MYPYQSRARVILPQLRYTRWAIKVHSFTAQFENLYYSCWMQIKSKKSAFHWYMAFLLWILEPKKDNYCIDFESRIQCGWWMLLLILMLILYIRMYVCIYVYLLRKLFFFIVQPKNFSGHALNIFFPFLFFTKCSLHFLVLIYILRRPPILFFG